MKRLAILGVLATLVFAGRSLGATLPTCHAPADVLNHDVRPNKYSDPASDAQLRAPCKLAEHPTLQDAWIQFIKIYEPLEVGQCSSRETWSHALAVMNQLREWKKTGHEPTDWRIQHEAFADAMALARKAAK